MRKGGKAGAAAPTPSKRFTAPVGIFEILEFFFKDLIHRPPGRLKRSNWIDGATVDHVEIHYVEYSTTNA